MLVSFLESNSPYILALCERKLEGTIDSSSFSVRGYFPLIRKDSTHTDYLVVYVVKERRSLEHELPIENSEDSCLLFGLALFNSVS